MSHVRPMYPFSMLGADLPPTTPAWIQAVVYIASGGLFMGAFNYIIKRIEENRAEIRVQKERTKVEAAEAARHALENDASVRTAEIASGDKIYEASRKEIHRILEQDQGRIAKLENIVEELKARLDRTNIKCVKVYMALERSQFQNRSLVRLIKDLDKDFDESAFPPIDLTGLSPDTLFAPEPRENPKSMTGIIKLQPDQPDK